jgi:PEP-CTERM motif
MRISSPRIATALALVALITFVGPRNAHAGSLALTFTGGSAQLFPQYTVGWSFTVTNTISVGSLAWFDEGSDGFLSDHTVGIFTGTGSLLASTLVTTSDPLDGGFRFANIALLTLTPGEYVVAGTTGNDTFQAFCSGVTTAPGITYDEGLFVYTGNDTLTLPTRPSDRGIAYFGADFRLASVPEPASVIVLGTGILGLLAYGGRRRKVSRS